MRLVAAALLLTLAPALADGGPRPDPRVTPPPRVCKPGSGYVHQHASGDQGDKQYGAYGQQGGYGDKPQYGAYGQQGGYGDKPQYGGYPQKAGYGDKSQYGAYGQKAGYGDKSQYGGGQKAGYGASESGIPMPDSIRNWSSGADTWGQNK